MIQSRHLTSASWCRFASLGRCDYFVGLPQYLATKHHIGSANEQPQHYHTPSNDAGFSDAKAYMYNWLHHCFHFLGSYISDTKSKPCQKKHLMFSHCAIGSRVWSSRCMHSYRPAVDVKGPEWNTFRKKGGLLILVFC